MLAAGDGADNGREKVGRLRQRCWPGFGLLRAGVMMTHKKRGES